MLHSQYKQIFALFSLARCCWSDKSVNAGRKSEGGEGERRKEGTGNAKSCVKRDFVAGLSGESKG